LTAKEKPHTVPCSTLFLFSMHKLVPGWRFGNGFIFYIPLYWSK